MKVVSAAEMRKIDQLTSERYQVPSRQLMENAGRAVAEDVISMVRPRTAIVVCGKGNNGGDGLVAARYLSQAGIDVTVAMLAPASDFSGDAKAMLSQFSPQPLVLDSEQAVEEFFAPMPQEIDVIVDALLGTGFRPPLSPLYRAAIEAINKRKRSWIHAVDLPSGMEADRVDAAQGLHIQATFTTTFTALKPAHLFACDPSRVSVRSIGTPPEAVSSSLGLNLIAQDDVSFVVRARDAESHKGTYGHVLVLGGSTGMAGAPAMVGMAALRAGAGLVTVAVPKSVLPTTASFAPELMTIPLRETNKGSFSVINLEEMQETVRGITVVAVGPGAGQEKETGQFLRAFVDRSELPVVLDADGLNAFAGHVEQLNSTRRPLIVTPHPGEMGRLTGSTIAQVQQNRISIAREFAQMHSCFVVLKGNRTTVAEPSGQVWINPTGNPGMATAGTGDALTGMLAGLVGQYPERMRDAVIAAVYLHGLAGDLAAKSLGEKALIATDLINHIPAAYRKLTESCSRADRPQSQR